MARKLVSETTQAIVSDLADRRGMPGDLEFGDDWAKARMAIDSFVASAVNEAETETIAKVLSLLRAREACPSTPVAEDELQSVIRALERGEWQKEGA